MIIEIIRIPAGSAPEWARMAWIGIRMNAEPLPSEAVEADLITYTPIGNRNGYQVEIETAINALAAKSLAAAKWFQSHIPPGTPWLVFGPNEALVIS